MTPTVFIDSSVWIAALRSRSGGSFQVLRLSALGIIEPMVSSEVLTEVDRNVRKKLPGALRMYKHALAALRPTVQPTPSPEAIKDAAQLIHAKDAAILAAALQAGVDYLVTLDMRHFGAVAPHVATSIRIVTPGELLNDLLPDR